jgi:hypothetical protein
MAITRLARTPSTRAMRKSSAAARICRPSRVDCRNQVNATSKTALIRMVATCKSCSRTPITSTCRPSAGRKSSPLSRDPTTRMSSFCRKKLTANEEINSVVGSALRSGRNAARSVIKASSTATAMAPNSITGTGSPNNAKSA